MPEYITISEFAKRAGVTRQSVYKRLDKELQPFVKEVDSRKTIDISALEVYSPQTNSRTDCRNTDNATEEVTENCSVSDNETQRTTRGCSATGKQGNKTTVDSSTIVNATDRFTEHLEKEIEYLKMELAEKEKQIADKDKQITGYANEFAQLVKKEQEISEKALQAASQSQSLQGHLQKQALGEGDNTEFTSDNSASTGDNTVVKTKRKGFFSWFK